jgi:hypothetical protein
MVRKMSTEAEAKKRAIRARRSSAARRETSGTTREQPCHDRPGVPNTTVATVATVGALKEADDASLSRAGIDLPPPVDQRKSDEHELEDSDLEFERLEEHPRGPCSWSSQHRRHRRQRSPRSPSASRVRWRRRRHRQVMPRQAMVRRTPSRRLRTNGSLQWFSATSRSTRSWQAPHRPPRFPRLPPPSKRSCCQPHQLSLGLPRRLLPRRQLQTSKRLFRFQ